MNKINNDLAGSLASLGLGQSAEQAKDPNQLGQNEFLKLMITQLNNQDPFKPMENGDFIAQMAQFSAVTGLSDLQQSFDKLATSMQSNQALQASSLVGRSVLVPSAVGTLPAGGTLSGLVDLPDSSSNLRITVQDGAGQVLRQLELGPQAAGEAFFSWDGITTKGLPADPGRYYISAEVSGENGPEALETLVSAAVDSVTMGNNGRDMTLNLSDGNSVDLSSVRAIK